MISGTQFLWLCHYLLIALYLFLIFRFGVVWVRNRHVVGAIHKKGGSMMKLAIESPASNEVFQGMSTLIIGHNISLFFAWNGKVDMNILVISILAMLLAMQTEIIKHYAAIGVANEGGGSSNAGFGAETNGDNGQFDYDEAAFKGGGSGKAESTAYGFDKRHAADTKFWNVVDDPNASEQERRTAFDKILKAQAKRQGKTGRAVAKRKA